MDGGARPTRGAQALRLALALPLACVVLIGSVWLGQSLRVYRSPTESSSPTDEPTSQVAASASPHVQQQPTQFVKFPAGVSAQTSSISPSPDGAYFVGRTTDF